MPPIYTFFERADPIVSADGWMSLSHTLGRPNIYLPITISNDGSAVLTVEKITCTLTHSESGKFWEMEAVGYVDQSSVQPGRPANEFPFNRERISSGEIWSETFRCLQVPTEEQFRNLQAINNEFTQFLDEFGKNNPNYTEVVSFPSDIWLPAKNEFDETFDLSEGNYNIKISVMGIGDQLAQHVTSNFQIDDSELLLLRRHVEDYKYGYGLAWPHNPSLVVNKIID